MNNNDKTNTYDSYRRIVWKEKKNKYYCDLCQINKYNYCILSCCQKRLCSDCLDMLYDNTIPEKNELFKCIYCNCDIFDVQIKN